jgi:hypothetical protein
MHPRRRKNHIIVEGSVPGQPHSERIEPRLMAEFVPRPGVFLNIINNSLPILGHGQTVAGARRLSTSVDPVPLIPLECGVGLGHAYGIMITSTPVSLLHGKVLLEVLPTFPAGGTPGLPILKRLCLPQGNLDQIYDGQEGIRYLATCEFKPGFPRGNHYHRAKNEYLYLLSGEADLLVEDIITKEWAKARMTPGTLAYISTEIAHAIHPFEAGIGIEFSTTRFDPSDTQRYLLEQ